jgi:protein O-mannosyl-transferase
MTDGPSGARALTAPRLGLWLVLAVALAASFTGLWNGFTYDDVPIIVDNVSVHDVRWPWEYFGESYWGSVRGNSLYRPLAVIAYSLQWAAGDGSAFPFHLVNILLYVATAAAVYALARELLGDGFGLFAALCWAAHPVHVEAVANVVGQSEMLTAIPMLLAVLVYVRARTAGALDVRATASITVLFVVALLTKEHGIVLPGLLVAAELAFRGHRFATPAAGAGLLRLARMFGLVLLFYFTTRYVVLGALAGDAPHPALEPLEFWERQWVVLGLIPELVRLMLWPARLYADYSPQAVPLLAAPSLGHLPGVLVVALYGAAMVWAWRRSRAAFFALLWFPVAFAPVANVVFATGIMLAERTLFLPSVGAMLALGAGAAAIAPAVHALPTRGVRLGLAGALAALLIAATAQSAARQRIWEDNATLFASMVVDAPTNYRAHHALGELFGAAASWERAEGHLRIADALFPGYDLVELSLARVLHFDDRCPDALPVYEQVLAKRPDAEVAAVGRTACLLEMRRYSAARDGSVLGLANEFNAGVFHTLLSKAESALVANDTIDARNRWHRAGRPASQSDARLKVPVLMMRPQGAGGRRRMPESLPVPPPPRRSPDGSGP